MLTPRLRALVCSATVLLGTVACAHAGMLRTLPLPGAVASGCCGAAITAVTGLVAHRNLSVRVPYGAWMLVGGGAGPVAWALARAIFDPRRDD